MKRLLAALMVLAIALSMLNGCASLSAGETTQTTEAPEAFVTSTLIQGGASEYVIVHDGTQEAKTLATNLRVTIVKNFGVDLKMVSANEAPENPCEIVVGQARPVAEKTVNKLTGKYDFAVKVEENKLVLCAKDALSYMYLGEYLSGTVFAKTDDGNLILDSDDNVVYSKSALTEKNYIDLCLQTGKFFSLEQIFDWGQFTNADTTLPYRIYVPFNYSPDKSYPLVVNLHGAGHRGNDNSTHLKFIDTMLKMPELSLDDAIIICPQCPEGQKWVDTDWNKGSYDLDSVPESNELKAVVELIGQLQQTYSVDANRIYACGFSMGGYGTWNLLMNHPELFCAGVAMCGAGDPSKAASLVNTPVWAIHGVQDPTVPVSGSQQMVQAIQGAGGQKIHYTELPENAHDVWTYTYANQEIWQWLFSQTKA